MYACMCVRMYVWVDTPKKVAVVRSRARSARDPKRSESGAKCSGANVFYPHAPPQSGAKRSGP